MKNETAWKIAALVPLGLMTLVLLAFGLGESTGGDWSGLGHFLPILLAGVLAWLAWKAPRWGGWILLVSAALQIVRFGRTFFASLGQWLAPFVILILPLALSGLLFLVADVMTRRGDATHS